MELERGTELLELASEQSRLQLQLDAASRRKFAVDLGAALEQREMGLHFEVVDEGAVADGSKQRQLNASIAKGAENVWNGNWKFIDADGSEKSIGTLRR